MKRKRIVINVICFLVIAAFLAFATSYYFYRWIYGYRGVVPNVAALSEVYRATDDENLISFYTNSFLHRLTFVEPIRWHRDAVSLSLNTRVDVRAFRRDMAGEPFIRLFADSNSKGLSSFYHFQVLHRLNYEDMVETTGTIDASSGAFTMSSASFYRKMDDSSWYHFTNSTHIDFAFETQTNNLSIGQ